MSQTNQKGDIGEAAFVLAAAKRGYWVGKMPQDCPYDFVIDRKKGTLERVQVKFRTVGKDGAIRVKIANDTITNRTSYSSKNIDYFAVYVPELEEVFYIPVSVTNGIKEIAFRCNPAKNNQTDKVNLITEHKEW